MAQDFREVPSISIGDYMLEVVEDFTYLGCTISNNLSLEAEIGKRIGKSSFCHIKTVQEIVGERHADNKHQDLSVQRLRVEHLTMWQ